jgi:hypothetical protein
MISADWRPVVCPVRILLCCAIVALHGGCWGERSEDAGSEVATDGIAVESECLNVRGSGSCGKRGRAVLSGGSFNWQGRYAAFVMWSWKQDETVEDVAVAILVGRSVNAVGAPPGPLMVNGVTFDEYSLEGTILLKPDGGTCPLPFKASELYRRMRTPWENMPPCVWDIAEKQKWPGPVAESTRESGEKRQ